MVVQIGFSICFPGQLSIAPSYVCNSNVLKKLLLTLRRVFQKKAHEWLLLSPDFFQCEASDTVTSLTSFKKHGFELKFFVSIFGKLNQIKI